jgi:hypothetical protein
MVLTQALMHALLQPTPVDFMTCKQSGMQGMGARAYANPRQCSSGGRGAQTFRFEVPPAHTARVCSSLSRISETSE